MARRSRPDRRTPRALGEWVLGRRKAPAVIDGPVPYQPDLLLLVDAGSGFVVGSEIVKPDASDEVVAAWAEEKLGPGVSLRVDDERLADALRARLGRGQAVRVGPIPELRAPLAALTRFMGRGDGQILRLDVPTFGWEGACASILGAGEEEFGLLLFRSLDDYVAFVRLSGPHPTRSKRSRGPGVPILAVSYDHPDSLPGGEELEKNARILGWKPGNKGRLA